MPAMPPATLVLIPGLGADAAVFAPQQRFFGDRLVVLPWIKPLGRDETLENYARRLGTLVREMPNVTRPYHVGGVSFGGMLATELAEVFPQDVQSVFLLAACRDHRQISWPFRNFEFAARLAPAGLSKALLNRGGASVFSWWQGLGPADTKLIEGIATRTFVDIALWGARAFRLWRTAGRPRCPVYHAHGRRDMVIPASRLNLRAGVDLVVPDGRHLMHLTHAEAVNRWLLERMDGPSEGSGVARRRAR